MRKSKDKC